MAKTLELTDEQQELLADLLKGVLGDLSYEIADTDNSTFKDKLKKRRDALKALAQQLQD
ncbi:MAG: hypothetical protein WD396_05075 [Pseudohongiellaceae bacterium]